MLRHASPEVPNEAQLHRIEGLLDYDQKDYVPAQLELERAVELDAGLGVELKPLIDECEKAPPKP